MRSLILCLLLLSVSQASNCPSFGCSDNALLRRLETESVCNQKFALLEEGFDRAINSQNPNSTDFLEAVTTLYRDVLAPDFSAFIWPTPQTTPRYLSGRDQIIGFTVVLTQIFRYRRAIPEYIVYESYTDNGLRSAETFVRITQHFRNNTGFYWSDHHFRGRCVELTPGEFRWQTSDVRWDQIYAAHCGNPFCGRRELQ